MVSLSLLAGCSSDSSEDSTYSLREQCNSTTEPVNRADQHLRGLKQEPGVSQAIVFMQSTCVCNMCQLFINANKINNWIVSNKWTFSCIFWTALTD